MSTATPASRVTPKTVLCMIFSAALACCLCPSPAQAAQLEAGQAGSQALSAQAASKTVYVITSVKETSDWGIKSTSTTKYTYNENYLVKKSVKTSNMDGATMNTYAYKGTTLKSSKQTSGDLSVTTTHKANSKGQFTKATTAASYPGGAKETKIFTATYKSGKISKIVSENTLVTEGTTSNTTNTLKYAYKKGLVASRPWDGYKLTYGYDANGNLNDIGGSKYKNKYNAKKQLSKTTMSEEGYSYTKTYTYKAVKVKASVANKVEAQQWAIANSNLNFALGIDVI